MKPKVIGICSECGGGVILVEGSTVKRCTSCGATNQRERQLPVIPMYPRRYRPWPRYPSVWYSEVRA